MYTVQCTIGINWDMSHGQIRVNPLTARKKKVFFVVNFYADPNHTNLIVSVHIHTLSSFVDHCCSQVWLPRNKPRL